VRGTARGVDLVVLPRGTRIDVHEYGALRHRKLHRLRIDRGDLEIAGTVEMDPGAVDIDRRMGARLGPDAAARGHRIVLLGGLPFLRTRGMEGNRSRGLGDACDAVRRITGILRKGRYKRGERKAHG